MIPMMKRLQAASSILVLVLGMGAARAQEPTTGKAGKMTPDIGLNTLMLFTKSNRGNHLTDSERNGLALQESELQFTADVDPYSRLNAIFAIHQEPASPREREDEWKIEPEELYIDTTQVPAVNFRIGKFYAALGKHNLLHTHAFPFVDAPLVNSVLLGEEGFNDYGVSASWLAPTPWFFELTGQGFSGRPQKDSTDTAYFNNASANTAVGVVHLKNLVDLSESLTGELGLSYAQGSNEHPDVDGINQVGSTVIYGADLTFKWRPVEGGKSRAFIWSTEYLNRRINRPNTDNQALGFASWMQYQFTERWWIQARTDYLQATDSASAPTALALEPFQRRWTALLGFFPSEFSAVRLQYSYGVDDKQNIDPEKKVYVQFNFSIGAHPAHAY